MNPWTTVAPADYEAHMTSPAVAQLSVLSDIVARELASLRPASVLVVGCATGNGFEHIDPRATGRVVGIDVNRAFLAVLRERHGGRLRGLDLFAADILDPALEPGTFELVHAGLIFEHVLWQPALRRIVSWLAPAGTLSVVLQLPSAEAAPVSASVIADRYPEIARTMRLVEAAEFARTAGELGLVPEAREDIPLPQGKAFLALRYRRSAPPASAGA